MRNFFTVLALAGFAALFSAQSTNAQAGSMGDEDQLGQMICPIEMLGDEDGLALSVGLSDVNAALSDEGAAKLDAAVQQCTQQHGWTPEKRAAILKFNVSTLGAMGLIDRLAAVGIDAEVYEVVLDELDLDGLRAFVDAPDKSPVMGNAIDMLRKDHPKKMDAQNAGHLGAYLVQTAAARLQMIPLMGLE
jgi:hypothetical protein